MTLFPQFPCRARAQRLSHWIGLGCVMAYTLTVNQVYAEKKPPSTITYPQGTPVMPRLPAQQPAAPRGGRFGRGSAPAPAAAPAPAPAVAPRESFDLPPPPPSARPSKPSVPGMRNRAPFDGQTHGRTGSRNLDGARGAEPAPGVPDEQARPAPARPPKEVTSEPWLSPKGERLVAVVNDRYLTQPDLQGKVQLALRNAPPIMSTEPQLRKQLETERWESYAREIMNGWVMTTALAMESERIGTKVTQEEIDEALGKLAEGSEVSMQQVNSGVKMLGVPEAHLREEVRQGLLVEKFIMQVVRNYGDDYLKSIYEADPTFFAIPPKVHAFHIFRFLDPSMTKEKQEAITKEMKKLRKELEKKNPDFAALTRISDKDSGTTSGDMGWVSADASLQPEMFQALFQLEPGQTSEVFGTKQGLHIIKVLEREEGSGSGFERARPQVENYLFEKTKPAAYEAIMGRYTIRMNSGGLNRWKEIGAPKVSASEPEVAGTSSSLGDLPAAGSMPVLPAAPSGRLDVAPPPVNIHELMERPTRASQPAAAPQVPAGASLESIYRNTRPRSPSQIVR